MWKGQRLEGLTVCCKNPPFLELISPGPFAGFLWFCYQFCVSACAGFGDPVMEWSWLQHPWLLMSLLDVSHCLTWMTPSCSLQGDRTDLSKEFWKISISIKVSARTMLWCRHWSSVSDVADWSENISTEKRLLISWIGVCRTVSIKGEGKELDGEESGHSKKSKAVSRSLAVKRRKKVDTH